MIKSIYVILLVMLCSVIGFESVGASPILPYEITQSGLQTAYETDNLIDTSGTQAEINAQVESAIVGKTPIIVSLSTGTLDAVNYVRISAIDSGSNIQLWAKDTANNWYDINVEGWGPSTGWPLPSGYSAATPVYIISDKAGDYTASVNLVNVADNSVMASASEIIHVQDTIKPVMDIAGFTYDGKSMMYIPYAGYLLDTLNNKSVNHLLQFKSASYISEKLKETVIPLYLDPVSGQTDALIDYYLDKPAEYRTYLNAAAAGSEPFAYIKVNEDNSLTLLDGAQYYIAQVENDMVVPDDFPLSSQIGDYTVVGTFEDLAGNINTIALTLIVAGDRYPPELTITGFTADGVDMLGSLTEGYTLVTHNGAGNHLLQFKAASVSSEAIKGGLIELRLVPSIGQTDTLIRYYSDKEEPYRTYLNAAAAGIEPFALIKVNEVGDTNVLSLYDAAQDIYYMVVPDNFPLGEYTVTGDFSDEYGNTNSLTLKLIVAGDRVNPMIGSHEDILVDGADSTGVIVNYELPLASDDVDGTIVPVCLPASGNEFAVGTTTVTCTATDTAGNGAQTSFVVKVLAQDQHIAIGDTEIIGDGINELIVLGAMPTLVIVPQNGSQSELNLAVLKDGSGKITLVDALTIVREGINNNSVLFAAGTEMTGIAGWDGKISVPTIRTSSDYSIVSGKIDIVIDIGTSDELIFSKPVAVVLGGMHGKKAAWSQGSGVMTEITTICDNAIYPTNINSAGPKECYIDIGNDLLIWTYHFTAFSAFSLLPPAASHHGSRNTLGASLFRTCQEWSECVDGTQTRLCSSRNSNVTQTKECQMPPNVVLPIISEDTQNTEGETEGTLDDEATLSATKSALDSASKGEDTNGVEEISGLAVDDSNESTIKWKSMLLASAAFIIVAMVVLGLYLIYRKPKK